MVSEHANPTAPVGGVDAGGQNVHVDRLARTLAQDGHDVVIYTRRDSRTGPNSVEMCTGATVELVPAGPAAWLPKDELLPHMDTFGDYLAGRWAADPPDVVHAHYWTSGVAAIRAAAMTPVPVVQTYHMLGTVKRRHLRDADPSPPERIHWERTIARRAARIVATCGDEVRELEAMGADRRRISVVPCGVDVRHFTPQSPAAIRGEGARLVTVGRLTERKGIDTVIRALAALPGVDLLVAGGPSRERLHEDADARRLCWVAERSKVAGRVTFLGGVPRSRMAALLRSADAVVCTPWFEPFGLVALEAMACGIPVVAAAVGGLTETVADGVTGLLVPPRDEAALASALAGLLADPPRRREMGRAGRRRVEERYAWPLVAKDTADVYQLVRESAG
jgi:glycosyltransferase involved in cell wall biosynthesis